MNHQIKHRYTGAVLFECDVPEQKSGMVMRYTLEKAVQASAYLVGANLKGANLEGANLEGANLTRAYLVGVNLVGANLTRAYLVGANLKGANLEGANLEGAYLAGANLVGVDLVGANLTRAYLVGANLKSANLEGAKFSGDKLLIGKRPFFTIGPIGSRCALVSLWLTDKGPMVKAGCFTGTLEEFTAAVEKTHGETDHGKEYAMAILMMESHATLWGGQHD